MFQPESDFFDPENPEKNNNLTSFAVRTREMKELHELGAGKLYLHLDGWQNLDTIIITRIIHRLVKKQVDGRQ